MVGCSVIFEVADVFCYVSPLCPPSPPPPYTPQEEDFQEMVSAAQLMESQYGHLFEKVIVNDDLSAAFCELRQMLKKVEMETHWVPISWTHS